MSRLPLYDTPPGRRPMPRTLRLLLLLSVWGCHAPATLDPAVAIEELGGVVKRDARGDIVELAFRYRPQVSDGGLAHLSQLGTLRRLDLDRTPVTDAGLQHLAGLSHLQRLWLRGTRVSDSGLMHLTRLPRLTELRLTHCRQISDGGVASLKRIKGLKRLAIEGTRITESGIAELRASLPECEIY